MVKASNFVRRCCTSTPQVYMSLYADYIKENLGDETIENDYGFLTYRYINSETVYIIDIYIEPNHRKSHLATEMANTVSKIAKNKGCKQLLGSVVPTAKNSADSMRVLLSYGMKPYDIVNNMVMFRKDI